jgi:hypothetical protein
MLEKLILDIICEMIFAGNKDQGCMSMFSALKTFT